MEKVLDIPVNKIKVGEYTLRMEIEDEDISELAASIRRIGVIVPLVVRPEGDSYVLIAGHRRLAASRNIGLETVPCCISQDRVAAGTEISFAENLFRKDLSPVELAAGLKDVLDQGLMGLPELAGIVHRTEHWVMRQVDMLGWPPDVLKLIHAGRLSVSAASNLALVHDEKYRGFLIQNALDNGATARTTAAWLQAYRSMSPPEAAVEAEPVNSTVGREPAVPQAPCIVCGEVRRTDALSMVMICSSCINAIRGGVR